MLRPAYEPQPGVLLTNDAQQHSTGPADEQILLLGSQCYLSDGLCAAGVCDRDTLDSVNSTGIGREDPQRLKAIFNIQRATTLGFGLRANANQDSAVNSFSHGFTAMVCDRPSNSINFITADLARGGPDIRRAEARRNEEYRAKSRPSSRGLAPDILPRGMWAYTEFAETVSGVTALLRELWGQATRAAACSRVVQRFVHPC